MFKGHFVLLKTEELVEKISTYLERPVTAQIEDDKTLTLIADFTGLTRKEKRVFIEKLAGKGSHEAEDLFLDAEGLNCLPLDFTSCSHMLRHVFDISEPCVFDDESMLTDDAKYVYLLFVSADAL